MNARGKPIQATSLLMVSSSIFFLLLAICHSDLIDSLFCTILTQVEIDQLVAHLFVSYPIPRKEGTKPPYVCPGCSNHTHGNNMINRCNVIK
jgi:hypothetical protein